MMTPEEREAWLAWRREGVGASDVAGILGLSPWASPWSVWADKLGLLPDEDEDEYMAAGRWLEAAIGPWFAHKTGLYFAGPQLRCESVVDHTHRCTVDGFAFDGPTAAINVVTIGEEADERYFTGQPSAVTLTAEQRDVSSLMKLSQVAFDRPMLGPVEIKVTGPGRRWEEIPVHHQAQGQWQMHVTGLDHLWLPVLMGRRLDIHELERDQADIDLMVERVNAFWSSNVLTAEPPPADDHDATMAAIAAVYPTHIEGKALEADEPLMRQLRELVDAKARIKAAGSDEKGAKARLAAALRDAEELTIGGVRVLTYRQQNGRTTTCKACGHQEHGQPFRVMRPAKGAIHDDE